MFRYADMEAVYAYLVKNAVWQVGMYVRMYVGRYVCRQTKLAYSLFPLAHALAIIHTYLPTYRPGRTRSQRCGKPLRANVWRCSTSTVIPAPPPLPPGN